MPSGKERGSFFNSGLLVILVLLLRCHMNDRSSFLPKDLVGGVKRVLIMVESESTIWDNGNFIENTKWELKLKRWKLP